MILEGSNPAALEAALIEKSAELDRVQREALRAEAERARAEALAAQLHARDQEFLQLRERSQKALAQAEADLETAARKLEEASAPRPAPAVNEVNDARVRAARLSAELAELRAERDELRLKLEALGGEIDGARASAAALRSAISIRDQRAGTAEAAQQSAEERLRAALADATGARAEQDRLGKSEEEARAAATGALRKLAEQNGALDLLRREEEALAAEGTRLRAELEAERAAARAREVQLLAEARAHESEQLRERESQIVAEVRERESRMVAEVREREAQLVAGAQAREAQLLAQLQQLQQDHKDATEQITALTRVSVEAREREAALDAELRLARGTWQESQEQLEAQLESARADVRKLQADAQIASDSAPRAESRSAELQAVVDSLGRERAALRSEAGAMRARVELLAAADERSRRLAAELEDLRGEYDFLNQELARVNSPRTSAPPPLPSKT